jgi:molybdate transport system ATP-binding protein
MLISIEDITIRVGTRHLFEHTTWSIEKDQNWAIIGENGSGKSILAKAICRKIPLIQGRISYHFDEIDGPEGRTYLNPNEILMLSAETHRDFLKQYSWYHQARWQSFEGEEAPTVASLLTAKSIQYRSPYETGPQVEDEEIYLQKRDYAVRLLKLDYLMERRIHTLSHGESRKAYIARLLMHSPRLLILDDPYVGLDRETRATLSQGIEQLIEAGDPKILLIGSRNEEIPDSIDHVLVVRDTRVAAKGERETVMNSPEFIASFCQQSQKRPNAQLSAGFKTVVERYASALKRNTTPDSAPLIEMADISVTYGNVEVLKNISWTVKQSERWMLLGHNGAGKSTLLSLILADNPQSYANTISLFGKERGSGESVWDIKKNIGWVSPELQIYYAKTVSCLEVVCSGFFDSVGLFQACSADQIATASDWINAFRIETLSGSSFQSISTGQQRLVLLARALVKNPVLLILDEPCQGLDGGHRDDFIGLIDQLCGHIPITLIYVSHHAEEMPNATTHQLKLEHGRISQIGPLR